jgi:dTDP-4-dehydrorhamnose reductase
MDECQDGDFGMEAKTGDRDSKITTVLLLGSNGQLGSALRRCWSQDEYQQKLCIVASNHEALDISNKEAVENTLEQISPDVVVNCAGYNDPCSSQLDRDACWRTNSSGPSNLAEGCAKRGSLLVHISCDSVFGADNIRTLMLADAERLAGLGFCVDGIDCRYDENSPCGPVDYHGTTKLAGESSVLRIAASNRGFRYWILRTGSLFEYPWRVSDSYFYKLASMVKSNGRTVPVVSDMLISLCYVPELVKAVDWMIENRWVKGEDSYLVDSGIYHMANEGTSTWLQVAKALGRSIGGNPDLVIPVKLEEYRRRYDGVMPPMNGLGRYRVLSTERYKALGGPQFSHWTDVVDKWCLAMGGTSLAVA